MGAMMAASITKLQEQKAELTAEIKNLKKCYLRWKVKAGEVEPLAEQAAKAQREVAVLERRVASLKAAAAKEMEVMRLVRGERITEVIARSGAPH